VTKPPHLRSIWVDFCCRLHRSLPTGEVEGPILVRVEYCGGGDHIRWVGSCEVVMGSDSKGMVEERSIRVLCSVLGEGSSWEGEV